MLVMFGTKERLVLPGDLSGALPPALPRPSALLRCTMDHLREVVGEATEEGLVLHTSGTR